MEEKANIIFTFIKEMFWRKENLSSKEDGPKTKNCICNKFKYSEVPIVPQGSEILRGVLVVLQFFGSHVSILA